MRECGREVGREGEGGEGGRGGEGREGGRDGRREGGMEGGEGRGGEGRGGEGICRSAPRKSMARNNVCIKHVTYYVITHSVSTLHNNGTYYVRLDVDTVRGPRLLRKTQNSTQNKRQTYRAKQYKVTSFLSTDCELSTNPCSKNVYNLGPGTRN